MGVFNEPERLARILASIKVSYETRPLSPIEVANELRNACDELNGDKSSVQKRFGLGNSMWHAFKRLLDLSEDIQSEIKWGESNSKSLQVGFSAAHVICKFSKEDQNKLVEASWEHEHPLTHKDLEDVHSFKINNPEKTIEECISAIFKVNHPTRITIRLYIAGLDTAIFTSMQKEATNQGISIKELSKQALSRSLPDDSVMSVSPKDTFVRISFSNRGMKAFEKLLAASGVQRNEFVNYLFKKAGF